jgi:hypothetical protein
VNKRQRMLNRITAERLRNIAQPRRAGGGVICRQCGREYRDHPRGGEPGYDGEQFLNRLCDGRLVKL